MVALPSGQRRSDRKGHIMGFTSISLIGKSRSTKLCQGVKECLGNEFPVELVCIVKL